MSASRYEPVGNTCPTIDEIIADLEGCVENLKGSTVQNISDVVDDTVKTIKSIYKDYNSPIEKVRSANQSLRNWGNELVEDLEEAEKEITRLEQLV